MRTAIVTLAFILSAAAPAAAVTVGAPAEKTDFDAVHSLQMESSLPVRQVRRVISPIAADFPSDHVHIMRMPVNPLMDILTTRENKAHALLTIFLGKK
jgi:hypothetical protein